MSVLIALLTGVLAFVGVLLGHFVSSDLNAVHKRRDIRRAQLERLGEFISEDRTWMSNYRREMAFGAAESPSAVAPFDRARAIYHLYFHKELEACMSDFMAKRHAYDRAIDKACLERIQTAAKDGKRVSEVAPSKAALDEIQKEFGPYYEALTTTLGEASKLINATMPEELETGSPFKRFRQWLRI
jgi:hypothetical protein